MHSDTHKTSQSLAGITLAALGIVYGDIGTSPLYTVKECFIAEKLSASPFNVLGFISLIFWAIIVVVTFKYVLFILRADNHQEGGIMVLMALARRRLKLSARWVVILLGLSGSALFYGDAVITPAISVLSASEGLQVLNSSLEPYVLPVAIGILLALFLIQRFGTTSVGRLFGPIMFLWFFVLGVLGLFNIYQSPDIIVALNPWHGINFILTYGAESLLGLGSVVLALTGAEALYADMGHFGRRPITQAWFSIVLPSLALNYLGQGALLLRDPTALANPFFLLAPDWALPMLIGLAAVATVIASQAVISGAYSLTRQAIQLDFCPRLKIRHTSIQEMGQIYLPFVNWILLVIVLVIVLGFRSSSNLAAAYGIAVTGTMMTSTLLFFVVMYRNWHWPLPTAVMLTSVFLVIDFIFFSANLLKIANGGWLPLIIGLIVFTLMSTWKRGRKLLASRIQEQALPLKEFIKEAEADSSPARVKGTAIFLARTTHGVPHALLHNLKHNKVLHERVVLMTIKTEDVPFVNSDDRVEVASLAPTFFRVIASYGFKETPNIPSIIECCAKRGLPFDLLQTSFFLSKETLISTSRPGMAPWRERLFIWMSKNALRPTDFFQIPIDRVVELGAQIEL